jgi:pyruvate/2-oxoacid:ferredoxin oxidoreductase beta subunit
MNDEEMEVVEAMEKYGGSFVKSLAGCFRHADRTNINKLFNAFPEYWKQYEDMAQRKK